MIVFMSDYVATSFAALRGSIKLIVKTFIYYKFSSSCKKKSRALIR